MISNNYASYYIPPSAVQYNNYVSAQTIGPLNSSQTPPQIGYHNYGSLNGKHPNPPQFYPSDNSSEFSQSRRQYSRATGISQKQQLLATERAKFSHPNRFFSMSTQNQYSVSTHTNYIPPPASSLYTSIKKSQAVGKSSYKQGLPNSSFLTYKNYNKNDVKTAIRFARSGGCVAPKKKGAIYNPTCTNGRVCNIGAFTGQGY
jgi:hypothetical protein